MKCLNLIILWTFNQYFLSAYYVLRSHPQWIKQMISLTSWSLKPSRIDWYRSIKIINEPDIADTVGMLLGASPLVHPSLVPRFVIGQLMLSQSLWPPSKGSPQSLTDGWGVTWPALLPQGRTNSMEQVMLRSAFFALSYSTSCTPLQASFMSIPSVNQSIAQESILRLCFWGTWPETQDNSW